MTDVLRGVRSVHHFDPKSDADVRRIEAKDPALGAILRARQTSEPYGHDLITLTCRHITIRVRPTPVRLWMKLPCDMCTRREAELSIRSEQGERRRQIDLSQRAEARILGEEEMAKKVASKKQAGPKASRAWKQSYQFAKALKLEPPKDGIRGVIYAAIRSVKKGTIDDVTAAAVKGGLKDLTKQDPRQMTQSLLRQLAEDGAVKIVRDETATAAPAKAAAKKSGTKKIVLRKAVPAADAANA